MINLISVTLKKIKIAGVEDYYCSDTGKIFKKNGEDYTELVISHPSKGSKDYQRVTLRVSNEDKTDYVNHPFPVAYLICGTYKGWYHHTYKVVHIDGDKSNCHADNLKWTPRKFEEVRRIIGKHSDIINQEEREL